MVKYYKDVEFTLHNLPDKSLLLYIIYPQASDIINFSDKQNKPPTCIHVITYNNTVPDDVILKSSGPVKPTYLFSPETHSQNNCCYPLPSCSRSLNVLANDDYYQNCILRLKFSVSSIASQMRQMAILRWPRAAASLHQRFVCNVYIVLLKII